VQHFLDANNEHRARIIAANGEILFVSSEGYKREKDLIVSQELARRALNDAYHTNPACTDAAMAKRDAGTLTNALLNAVPLGSLASYPPSNAMMAVFNQPPAPENALIRARTDELMEVIARPDGE
jgi:uncharacterized protein YegP (UPF0339 family)